MTRKPEFLNYSVSRSTDPQTKNQFCVTAEFVDGYDVLSFHKTKAEADEAMTRYQQADKRRQRSK